MERQVYLRALALYVPIMLALLAGLGRRQPARQFAACLLSLLWTLPSLLVLERLNEHGHWWVYASSRPSFAGVPLELYVGWAVLWGVLPQLVFPRLALWKVAVVMVALDVVAMPLCGPVVQLGAHWLVGEAVAAVLVLGPALVVARCTLRDAKLPLRAGMQMAIAGLLFLYLVPEIAFAGRPGGGWGQLFAMASWKRQLWLQIVFIAGIPGLGAVMEFAERGEGTPIPYDPPKRLVESGMYRYCANPMQCSCAVVMLLWAAMLRNGWLLAVAILSVVYSAGIASWDEGGDLAERFGEPWRAYRRGVRSWRPRWRPYHAGPAAKLYVASSCGMCSEVRAWLEARRPLGLEMVEAETLPPGSIRRIRYEPGGESSAVQGVRAVGRALEHLNLGWAVAGTALRLPGVWQFVQLMMDASGAGPRTLQAVANGGQAKASTTANSLRE